MLRVNLPVLGRIHPQSNKFVTGVRTKAIGDSERNDSLGPCLTTFPNTEERVSNKTQSEVFDFDGIRGVWKGVRHCLD